MTNTSKNPAGAGSDDPWEQLAEDLFGLEYGKEHSAGNTAGAPTPEAAQASPVAEPPPASKAVEFAPEPVAEEPVREARPVFDEPAEEPRAAEPAAPSPQDSYWDALANWNWDDGEGSGTRGKRPEPRDERRSGDRPRDEGRSAPPAPRPSERPAPPERQAPPERSAPPPRRESTEARRGSPRAGSDDFGAGAASDEPVWGEVPESRTPVSESPVVDDDFGETDDDEEEGEAEGAGEFAEAETEGGRDEGAPRKRRRRRRRRRSRPGESDTPVSGAAPKPVSTDIPGTDWDDDDAPAAAPQAEAPQAEAPRSAPPARGDRERKRDDEGPRRSRRRRGDRDRGDRDGGERGRGERAEGGDRDRSERGDRDRNRREPAQVSESATAPDDEFSSGLDEVLISSPGASPGDFDADDDEGAEAPVNYDDVPTWEEAISYLLHPNQVEAEGNGGSSGSQRGSAAPADQPRQTRHYGGRRR